VEKYGRVGQATDERMGHAHCMLDTQGYIYTLGICNTYCFTTATMVALTHLNVTLHIHCLLCVCVCDGLLVRNFTAFDLSFV
jgi:hypothetical protein